MKITTRIIAGYGLLIAIMTGLAVHQVFTIRRMQSINNALRETNFNNALICLQTLRDYELLEEYARKSFALSDPDYLSGLKEFQREYEEQLLKLKRNALSIEEKRAITQLEQFWFPFVENLRASLRNLPAGGSPMPSSTEGELERLRSLTDSLYQASLRTMSRQVEISRETAQKAATILWISVLASLTVGALVCFLIFRSISIPLKSLTEGTRAIAEGRFQYRLDSSRKDEFSQLAADFNRMTRRLNELDELKKDFVSHVSHELKTPLTSIRETLRLLLTQIPGALTDKQKRLVELSLHSERRLTEMIRNLLDLSKVEAGAIDYEIKDHDLVALARDALAEMEILARERQIEMNTTYPKESLIVSCDAPRITQVIINLLGNAIKFSPKCGTVYLQVESSQELPRTLPEHWHFNLAQERCFGMVKVCDNGPGIPDNEKERIFEKFHQLRQSSKNATQGIGLGLAISRMIVEAQRGALWVEDNPGGGSRFILLLPARQRKRGEGLHV